MVEPLRDFFQNFIFSKSDATIREKKIRTNQKNSLTVVAWGASPTVLNKNIVSKHYNVYQNKSFVIWYWINIVIDDINWKFDS